MKTMDFNLTEMNLDNFILSAEEMFAVRGGDDEPIVVPSKPPIKI